MNKHTHPSPGNADQLRIAVRIVRALAHPLRLKIISMIEDNNGTANVGEIYQALGIEQSIASQHLRVLRQASLVKTRRNRKFIFYSLDYERIARTSKALNILENLDGKAID